MSPAAPRARQQLPRHARVRHRREYVSLQREGRRRTTPHFVLVSRPRRNGISRLGLTVSRKVGNAVIRNRVKRRVREWFRRHRAQLTPDQDLLVIARPGAAVLTYAQIVAELGKPLRATWPHTEKL